MCFNSIFSAVLLLILWNGCLGFISRSIPDYLGNCYKNGGTAVNAPHNIQLLVELISKIEKANTNYNLRIISSSLLHSLRLDGIERSPSVKETENVFPYRATAFQFTKFSFLLDLLIPGTNLANIRDGLTESELCTLHTLISSTVDPWERGDEEKICPLVMGETSPSDLDTYHFIPFIKPEINRTRVPPSMSRCPIEKGIVQTLWGNISPGTLVAAISASLEPQNVKIQDILAMETETKFDFDASSNIYPLYNPDNIETFNKDFLNNIVPSNDQISNIFAASLAGDIAELAIRQGVFKKSNPDDYKFVSIGKWNDTLIPRHFYILKSKFREWEITDAEILAGIDGIIIAKHIDEWTTMLDKIRLSQIIEMYYSSYGIPMNHGIRACNRKQNVAKIFKDSNDIYEQTFNMVNLLWLRLSTVLIPTKEIKNISDTAVRAFENYWPKLVDKLPGCDVQGDTCPMDVVIVTDGSWSKYQTEELVTILTETLDVSKHGSSLGLIHGNTAKWIAPRSHNILQIFDNIANFTEEWPSRLDFPEVLTTIIMYLQNKTDIERESLRVAGLPNVIIIAAPTTKWSQADLDRSAKIMATLRTAFFDVYFLYLTSDVDGFKILSIDPQKHSDMLIETSSTNISEVAEMIRLNFIAKIIPKRLISPPCQIEKYTGVRMQYEDYINVGQKIIFRIHPKYLLNVPVVKVQFQGTDQGEIAVCLSRKYTEDAAMSCKLITEQYDANFEIKHPCNSDYTFCDTIYFIVKARNTFIKCADKDCRYPDQIRFFLRHEGIQCRKSNNNQTSNTGLRKNAHLSMSSFLMIMEIILFFMKNCLK